MTISEIQQHTEIINYIFNISYSGYYDYSDFIKFHELNDYVIHRIELINKSYDYSITNTPLELTGTLIGDIIYLEGQTFNIASLTEFGFYSFLTECTIEDLSLSDYTFKNDYIIIHQDFIDEFHMRYSSSSVIWGGFKISDGTDTINYYKKTVAKIIIPDELKDLDEYAKDSIYRALDQKSSFERFLKMYHLLELEFDYNLIKKIQGLNITTNSNQIGTLLNEYSRNETDRLLDLISTNCHNTASLAKKLNEVKNHLVLAEEIFIRFGKEKNKLFYLTDLSKFHNLLADVDAFESPTSVNTHARVNINDYDKLIHGVTAYWIYRIRCSIAHFKIGEYILTRDKENFIVEFAEPLIKEILIQFYKK